MKRILPIFLAVMLLLAGLTFSVSAEEESFDNIRTVLAQLNVMNGDPDGSFRPDDNVTRAEFAKIAIMASPYRDFVASGMNTSPFADVSFTHWAAPYIKLASSNKIITGYPDSTYRPEENVLMEEAVTVVVKMLGYTDEDFKASWPYGHIGVATNIGLLDGIDTAMGGYFSRRDVAKLLYNTLKAKPKSGAASAEYINSLGYSFVENVTILATAKENSSVGSNKVSTSNGTYKINEYFDYNIVGHSGDVLINTDSNELLLFFGKDIVTEEYVIDSVLDEEIIAVKDGNKVSLKISDNVDTYFKLQTSTLGSVKKSFKEGYLLTVAYDTLGNVEYLKVDDRKYQGMVDEITEVNYNVYSVLNGEILAYKDGNLVSLKLPDDLTVYDDSTTTSYGAIKNSLGTGYFLAVGYDGTNTAKYAKVVDEKLSGPVVVLGSFNASGYNLSSTPTVMRDGNKSNVSEIAKYDVVYYSQSLDSVWAYSKKVTGTFESAAPTRDNVTSVTIAGKTYNVETAEASIALSSSGDFVLGDTITVLLDKNGDVAGVVQPEDVSSTIYGILKSVGTSEFTDSDGNVITSRYAEVIHVDGTVVKYKVEKEYDTLKNSIVKITLKSGIAKITSERSDYILNGVVDSSKMNIGKTTVAENIKILEVTSDENHEPLNYKTIFLSRLDGVSISSSEVMYYSKNSSGEICELILLNATGDAYSYGIIKSAPKRVTTNSSGSGADKTSYQGNYEGLVGTSSFMAPSSTIWPSVYAGTPVRVLMTGNSVNELKPLSKISSDVKNVTRSQLTTSESTYRISDYCVVYDASYNVISFDNALDDTKYRLEFYVDLYGQTVRVIKAIKK